MGTLCPKVAWYLPDNPYAIPLTEAPFTPAGLSWELPYTSWDPCEARGCLSPEHSRAHSPAGPGCLKVCLCPTKLGAGPAGAAEAGWSRPYLEVWSRRAGGGQGWACALLQGQPVPRVGGWGRGLPGARRILGGTRRILASWQVLLPRVHLRKERGKRPRRRGVREAGSHKGTVESLIRHGQFSHIQRLWWPL